ncbi:MAG: hypothetical protein JNM68_08980 [Dinghuibacter sp.]|nr:hypothetical protein [Dinghuibacter sp.]
MEQKQTNTGLQWLIFFASFIGLIAAVYFRWEYLTLILPFLCTSFVKAMKIM